MRVYMFAAAIALTAIAVPAMAQPSPNEIISQGDKNGDKALDKAEWEAMGIPFPYPAEGDTNKDGKLDAAELQALFAAGPPGGGGGPPPAAPPAR